MKINYFEVTNYVDKLSTIAYSLLTMKQTTTKRESRKVKNHGMNWIRQEKRLAIYLRDGLSCAYCNRAVEDGVRLTLDHLTAYSNGGSNDPTNLVTCCLTCNASRGARSYKLFAAKVAEYLNHGVTAAAILKRIKATRKRTLDVNAAKELIARRGGFVAACQK